MQMQQTSGGVGGWVESIVLRASPPIRKRPWRRRGVSSYANGGGGRRRHDRPMKSIMDHFPKRFFTKKKQKKNKKKIPQSIFIVITAAV